MCTKETLLSTALKTESHTSSSLMKTLDTPISINEAAEGTSNHISYLAEYLNREQHIPLQEISHAGGEDTQHIHFLIQDSQSCSRTSEGPQVEGVDYLPVPCEDPLYDAPTHRTPSSSAISLI